MMGLGDAFTLHDAIPGATYNGEGSFNIPCSTTVQIEFVFNGFKYLINTQDLLATYTVIGSQGSDVELCESQILGISEWYWVLGAPFLRNVIPPDAFVDAIRYTRCSTITRNSTHREFALPSCHRRVNLTLVYAGDIYDEAFH
jgi:hypothetical protein